MVGEHHNSWPIAGYYPRGDKSYLGMKPHLLDGAKEIFTKTNVQMQWRRQNDNWGGGGGGGANIHISLLTDCKNNRFQKKLITQNTNILIFAPPQLSICRRHCSNDYKSATNILADTLVLMREKECTWNLRWTVGVVNFAHWVSLLNMNLRPPTQYSWQVSVTASPTTWERSPASIPARLGEGEGGGGLAHLS